MRLAREADEGLGVVKQVVDRADEHPLALAAPVPRMIGRPQREPIVGKPLPLRPEE